MKGISVVVLALVVIGSTVVFLLTFSRIMEALIRFLMDIEKEAIINGIGTINLYTALSMGDFYYYGSFRPVDANNFSVESPEKIRLVFPIGNVTTRFNLSEGILISKAISRHEFRFPKRGVYGDPFKVLTWEVYRRIGGIPFIRGMGKEITEYGYLGSSKIVEVIVDVCRTKTGREVIVNANIDIEVPGNKTIVIDGVPYSLENIPCYLEEGVRIEGYVNKLIISVRTMGNVTYIGISEVGVE